MIKNLGGSWPLNTNVVVTNQRLGFQKSAFSFDYVPLSEIKSAELVAADQHMSVGRKLGWGVAGALVAGPIGAAIGGLAAGNMKEQTVAVLFNDGRKAMLNGKPKELALILAAGFDWKSREQDQSPGSKPTQ